MKAASRAEACTWRPPPADRAKSALAIGRTALLGVCAGLAVGYPLLLPVLGVVGVGAAMAGSGAAHMRSHGPHLAGAPA